MLVYFLSTANISQENVRFTIIALYLLNVGNGQLGKKIKKTRRKITLKKGGNALKMHIFEL